jgi:hypothetical protein
MADQFNNTLVYNSITNKLDDEKRDLNSPFFFSRVFELCQYFN